MIPSAFALSSEGIGRAGRALSSVPALLRRNPPTMEAAAPPRSTVRRESCTIGLPTDLLMYRETIPEDRKHPARAIYPNLDRTSARDAVGPCGGLAWRNGGVCTLTKPEISEILGCSRSVVRNALQFARDLHLISGPMNLDLQPGRSLRAIAAELAARPSGQLRQAVRGVGRGANAARLIANAGSLTGVFTPSPSPPAPVRAAQRRRGRYRNRDC